MSSLVGSVKERVCESSWALFFAISITSCTSIFKPSIVILSGTSLTCSTCSLGGLCWEILWTISSLAFSRPWILSARRYLEVHVSRYSANLLITLGSNVLASLVTKGVLNDQVCLLSNEPRSTGLRPRIWRLSGVASCVDHFRSTHSIPVVSVNKKSRFFFSHLPPNTSLVFWVDWTSTFSATAFWLLWLPHHFYWLIDKSQRLGSNPVLPVAHPPLDLLFFIKTSLSLSFSFYLSLSLSLLVLLFSKIKTCLRE